MSRWILVLVSCLSGVGLGQTVKDLDPRVTAAPADGGVLLRWNAVPDSGVVTVLGFVVDGGAIVLNVSLDAGTTALAVAQPRGERYAYQLSRAQPGGFPGVSGVIAGAEVPFRDDQGVVAVAIDPENAGWLAAPLQQLEDDLRDDGFEVVELQVARGSSPQALKARLVALRADAGVRLRSLLLLGATPRPFSGLQNPDGHPDHYGAWGADPYYADLDGVFTDVQVGGVGTHFNDAGDGRFDQSYTPTAVELAVGRVDFESLPTFGADAGTRLLGAYLAKLHDARTGAVAPARAAAVYGGFGYFGGEAFSQAAWRDAPPIVGADPAELTSAAIFPTLAQDAGVLLMWGDGAGSPTSVGGVTTTAQLLTVSPNARLFALFGSYFGDWTYPDDVMRSVLGVGLVTHTFWYARPTVPMHALGALEAFGDAYARDLQLRLRWSVPIYQALLGDPTLRLFYPSRLGALTAAPAPGSVALHWPASAQPEVLGYHVYRRLAGVSGPSRRLTLVPSSSTTWTDGTVAADTSYEYRVVPVVLEHTGSGTFFNHGLGSRVVVQSSPAPVDAGSDAGLDGGEPDLDGGLDAGTDDAGAADAGLDDAGSAADGGSVADGGAQSDGGALEGSPDAGIFRPLPVEGGCGCQAGAGAWPWFALGVALRGWRRRGVRTPA